MTRFVLAAALALAATPAFALDLKSPDVTDGQTFDAKFICAKQGGSNISPAFTFGGAPDGTKSLAITMFDPDAGTAGFWHWLLVDMPPATAGLTQGAATAGATPVAGSIPVPNGAGQAAYAGPCPPPGKPHHYEITLYALPDAKAEIPAGAKAPDIGAYLAKEALATARITPIYEQK